MIIEEGKFYVLQSKEEGCEHEKYIMRILPRPDTLPEQLYRTETLGLHNSQMWENDWHDSYIQREATKDEIETFLTERYKNESRLRGIGEMVTGIKLEIFENSINALRKTAGRENEYEWCWHPPDHSPITHSSISHWAHIHLPIQSTLSTNKVTDNLPSVREIMDMNTEELSIKVAEHIFKAQIIGKQNYPMEKLLIGTMNNIHLPLSGKRWQEADWRNSEEEAWLDCPKYAEDMSAAALVESLIASEELRSQYTNTITKMIIERTGECEAFDLMHASPEMRCKAALIVYWNL